MTHSLTLLPSNQSILEAYKKIQQKSVEYPHLLRMIEEDEVCWNNDQFSFFHHKSPKHPQFALLIKQ